MIYTIPGGARPRVPGLLHSAWLTVVVALAAALTLTACGAKNKNVIPSDASQPDRFLFDRGNEALMKERWTDARQYFRQVVDNYPQSPLRPESPALIESAA